MDSSSVHSRERARSLMALGLTACIVAAGGLASFGAGSGRADSPANAVETVPGEVVVGFEPDASVAAEHAAVRRAGGAIERRLDAIDGAVVQVGPVQVGSAVDRLEAQRAVAFAEPNFVVRAARVPNDRWFGVQWGLANTGQNRGTPGADIGAAAAWDVTTSTPVTVAVVDTGVAYDHPDLTGNVWTNGNDSPNGLDDDRDGYVDDVHGADFLEGDADPADDAGHGTHVAGIIGAQGDNSIGVTGVDWDVNLMALKFLDENGDGNTADAAAAIDFAVDHGARVINASWGGPAFSRTLYQAIERAGARGVLVVAAAGNDGVNADSSPDYPAAYGLPNVISVAATDRDDALLGFSNYGATSVDLAAPGETIYSTVPADLQSSGYAYFSGTSMAAPFVSGAAALYLSRAPGADVSQLRDAILRGVDRIPALAGKTATGGRLDLAAVVGIPAPAPQQSRDTQPPAPFKLLRPRNRHASRHRKLRFTWQRSSDASGISLYRVYVNGRRVETVRDPDGPGGRDPEAHVRLKVKGGRKRWFVRAYDWAGNRRTSRTFRGGHVHKSSVVFVGRRR